MKKMLLTVLAGLALLIMPGMIHTSHASPVKTNASVKMQKVNINSASADQLTELKGIGAKKAASIVKFREENGQFKKPEDIMLVKGIGEKLFAKIKDRITTGK